MSLDERDRRPRFDGTINLGHLLTAGVYLVAMASGFAYAQAQINENTRAIARNEREFRDRVDRVEARFMEDQRRDREAFQEIKSLLRDIDQKLDAKQDKSR